MLALKIAYSARNSAGRIYPSLTCVLTSPVQFRNMANKKSIEKNKNKKINKPTWSWLVDEVQRLHVPLHICKIPDKKETT